MSRPATKCKQKSNFQLSKCHVWLVHFPTLGGDVWGNQRIWREKVILTISHRTCAIQINHLYTALTPTCVRTPLPTHTQVSTPLLLPLLHNGRCRVCLCKTIHAECHLCRDSCYKCMVQWELHRANVAVKVAMVACNTLVFLIDWLNDHIILPQEMLHLQ